MKETIKDKNYRILGYVETKSNGDKVVTTFTGQILGYYRKNMDVTTDLVGRVLARCDAAVALLFDGKF